jgi:hypothetical protein
LSIPTTEKGHKQSGTQNLRDLHHWLLLSGLASASQVTFSTSS